MKKDGRRKKHIGFVMDSELHDKFFYLSSYEGRTGNGQVTYLIRKSIAEFEAKHGKIRIPEERA